MTRGNINNITKEREMQVFTECKELIKYTFNVTKAPVRRNGRLTGYTKKWRFTLVNPMQSMSLEILKQLTLANETYVHDQHTKNLRIAHIKRALAEIKQLAYMVELSFSLGVIDGKRMGVWADKIGKVRTLTAGWFTATRNKKA